MTLTINSDRPAAADLLREIARICRLHGAWWHPQLRLEVFRGSMRMLAPEGTAGALITMPCELLLPIGGARWSASSERLQLLEMPAAIPALQRELLELHVELYNATGKLQGWSLQHPAQLVEASAAVADALAPLKPAHALRPRGGSPAERFLATRSFGRKPEPGQRTRQLVLLPLIDLLNHHHRGAPFRIRAGAMRIEAAQGGGSECFAHYGHRRDVLDLALHYGYSDSSTPFAHCPPLDIAIRGVGRLRVDHQAQRPPQDPLDPPQLTIDGDGLTLSHLCCDREHPERVRTRLRRALQAMLQRQGHACAEAPLLAERVLKGLASFNRSGLHRLVAVSRASDHPAALTLASAARSQAAIIAAVLG